MAPYKDENNDFDFNGTNGWLGETGFADEPEHPVFEENNNFDDVSFGGSSFGGQSMNNNSYGQQNGFGGQPMNNNSFGQQNGFGGNNSVGQPMRYSDFGRQEDPSEPIMRDENHPKKHTSKLTFARGDFALLFLWAAAVSGGMIWLWNIGEIWCIMPFVFQLVLGSIVFFVSKHQNRKLCMVLFFLADALFIGGLAWLRMKNPALFQVMTKHIAAHTLMHVFFFAGFGISFGSFYANISLKRRCTDQVTATIIDFAISHTRSHGRSTTTRTPIYQYTYQGREYISKNSIYSNFGNGHVDDECLLYVNPEDPLEFYAKRRGNTMQIFFALFGLAFMLMAAFGIYSMLSQDLALMLK